jgi:hypothetical protein
VKKVALDNLIKVLENKLKPAIKGSWVLLFGSLLGPAILITGRNRDGTIWPWVILTTIFVAFFLHRLSLQYTLTDTQLISTAWWGFGQPEVVTLSAIDHLEIIHSFSVKVINCAHIYVHSSLSSEGSIVLLAQNNADFICSELKKLSNTLKNE